MQNVTEPTSASICCLVKALLTESTGSNVTSSVYLVTIFSLREQNLYKILLNFFRKESLKLSCPYFLRY
jgi:hypothetical protein